MNTFDAANATCVVCGMLALRDPWLHEERYKHAPVFKRDGKLFEFLTAKGISVEIKEIHR